MLRDQGILPSQTIREYVRLGYIAGTSPIEESQIQPASIDLRLGALGFELRCSFLPGGTSDVVTKLEKLQLTHRQLDFTKPVILEPDKVYLIEVMESLQLPPNVWARANPRSTTGRADLFTRLLCDYSTEFEGVPLGYNGKLYVEVVPRTFRVRVKKGTRLNQIRLIREMTPETANGITREHSPVSYSTRKELLSLDLDPTVPSGIVGYRAKHHSPTLDFDCIACHDRLDFWEPLLLGELRSVVLAPDDFFLLRSKEKVVIDPSEAAELTPYDPSFGEFRVHYAGFLDPGFGFSKGGGTPVVLEVRTRDVAFLIEHAQKMAWVLYYQLDNVPDKIYGQGIGSAYYQQGITPGKQFRD